MNYYIGNFCNVNCNYFTGQNMSLCNYMLYACLFHVGAIKILT